MRSSTDTAHQERSMHEHSTQILREDLAKVKANYSDALRRENIVSLMNNFVSVREWWSVPLEGLYGRLDVIPRIFPIPKIRQIQRPSSYT